MIGRGPSVIAVAVGVVAIFAVTTAVDVVLHLTRVYPPWGEPMWDDGLNALALAYRLPINVAGSWLIARMAPGAPLAHAMIGGGIGLLLSIAGAVVAIRGNFGPAWYPIALAASALPSAWLGGWLYARKHPDPYADE